MEDGRLDIIDNIIKDSDDKKLLGKILKDIGYDREREDRSKIATERRFDEVQGNQGVRANQKTDQKQRISQHIDSLVKKLGTKAKTTVYHSLGELPSDVRRHIEDAHKRGRKVRGWYENGRVYLFLPDIDSTYQAEKTIWHETVAHHGLRQLIGDENLDRLLRHLWLEHKDGDMGTWVTKRMRENGWMLNNYRHNGKKIAGNLKRY